MASNRRVTARAISGAVALFVSLLLTPRSRVDAQAQSAGAADAFKRYSGFATKIQVVEMQSGAKSTIGSGFFVTAAGHVVTNYHVISSLINRPGRYRAELVGPSGEASPTTVLAIDVIHDLAILKSDVQGRPFFILGAVTPRQGERLYSIGNPRDLGMSIVEGTYNGLLEHTLYPRVHLTGSLNPGMSGGPTIDEQGRVIGVNVATAGNQVSFLVPVDRAAALLQTALALKPNAPPPSLEIVGNQLREHQNSYLRELFGDSTKTVDLGPFRVITQPTPFFRCWGDASHNQELPYERVRHRCDTEDEVFLDEDQTTGSLNITHQLITTKTLNASRFFALYSQWLGQDDAPSGEEQYVTNWKCVTRNVRNGKTRMRSVMCIRRYRELGELYDGSLKLAVLGGTNVGLVSTLNVTGVTFENLSRLSDRFLRQVSWR